VAEFFINSWGWWPWLSYLLAAIIQGTLLINVLGGFLIGVVIDGVAARPLLRPFAVTGILGGFTTFSTYAVDTEQLLAAGRLALAGAYLVGTLVGALVATWLGLALARLVRR